MAKVRSNAARNAAVGAGLLVGVYALLLITTGATSQEKVLPLRTEKHICEIDCHLAYSVVQTKHEGNVYVVTMRVRFDSTTAGPERGNGELYPGPRRIMLIAQDGKRYAPFAVTGLETPLRPGQMGAAELHFTLAPDSRPSLLRFEDADPTKRLLIGSETAPLHKRTAFRLT